jgi:hypothetical protein
MKEYMKNTQYELSVVKCKSKPLLHTHKVGNDDSDENSD